VRRKIWTNKDVLNYKRARSLAQQGQSELSAERMKKIQNHAKTERITYSERSRYKASYDYVDELFPNVDIKNVTVYRVEKSCLDRLGLKKIGGCYDKISRIVVISKELEFSSDGKDETWSTITAKITADEVIVHELLHYVSMHDNMGGGVQMEEEFAYGNSLEYLRSKGHSDDRIIVYNYLPYFMTVSYSKEIVRKVLVDNNYNVDDVTIMTDQARKKIFKKLDKELFKATKKVAIASARQLIRIYSKDENEKVDIKDNSGSKFGMMDFKF
jgi:hypothetical protein